MKKNIYMHREEHKVYCAPSFRVVQFFVQAPVMSLSNPTPGSAGDYDEDDDIIYDNPF